MKLPRYSPWWGLPLIAVSLVVDLVLELHADLFGPVMIGTILYAIKVK